MSKTFKENSKILQILKLKRYYEHTREKCHGWID
jgi:hypothetical protein